MTVSVGRLAPGRRNLNPCTRFNDAFLPSPWLSVAGMLIGIGYDLVFQCRERTAMVLALYTHPSHRRHLVGSDAVRSDPLLPIEEYVDGFGNRCGRLTAPPGRLHLWSHAMVAVSGLPDEVAPQAGQLPLDQLPADTLVYLLASRYCESDQLMQTAWQLFGHTAPGWARVQAICDWVHQNVTFGYQHARGDRTAVDVFNERRGVCRDFAHLSIAFCRAMNIPARYASGYLGDIGVPADPAPMDFSAWFEVYLGGRWYTFDARHNKPRIGRVLMVRGRDATDTAITTAFGSNSLVGFRVWTDELRADRPLPDIFRASTGGAEGRGLLTSRHGPIAAVPASPDPDWTPPPPVGASVRNAAATVTMGGNN